MKKNIFFLIVFCAILLSINNCLYANTDTNDNDDYSTAFIGELQNIYFGLGNLTQFVGRVQTDQYGSKNKFEFLPFLSTGIKLRIYKELALYPKLILTLPEHGRDEHISRFTYFLQVNFGLRLKDFLVRLGSGLAMTRISGDGGVEVLDNGLEQSSFPLPSNSSTSRNIILDLGIEYFITQEWAVNGDLFVYNLTDKLSRSYSYTIGIQYYLGQFWKN